MKSNVKSVVVHSQLSNNMHPMDGALVGVGLLWPGLLFDKYHNYDSVIARPHV